MQKHIKMDERIIKLLLQKSCVKQAVYRETKKIFMLFNEVLQRKAESLSNAVTTLDKSVEIVYSSKGDFESHLRFSGDTLLFHMHTNVFDFPTNHKIFKSEYLKSNPINRFCGIINIYNFLTDSLKYNRFEDEGYLIARVFINKDSHFFVEGEKPIGFLFQDFAHQIIDETQIEQIVDAAIIYALELDLQVPNLQESNVISVDKIVDMGIQQRIKTAKPLGFRFSHEK